MDAYRQELDEKIQAWVTEQLAASPTWGDDRFSAIQNVLGETVDEAA